MSKWGITGGNFIFAIRTAIACLAICAVASGQITSVSQHSRRMLERQTDLLRQKEQIARRPLSPACAQLGNAAVAVCEQQASSVINYLDWMINSEQRQADAAGRCIADLASANLITSYYVAQTNSCDAEEAYRSGWNTSQMTDDSPMTSDYSGSLADFDQEVAFLALELNTAQRLANSPEQKRWLMDQYHGVLNTFATSPKQALTQMQGVTMALRVANTSLPVITS